MRDRTEIESEAASNGSNRAYNERLRDELTFEVLLDIRQLLMDHAEKHEALARRRVARTRALTKRGPLK